jgi:hypothetical protein
MSAVFALSKRSIDQLEDDIVHHCEQLNIREYEFLVDLREFDLRQGWKAYHFNHCAEWLNFKCGIDVSTGREKVRVARALFDLPRLSAAFSTGRISYSKARSLTRTVTPVNEGEWLEFAESATAHQVQTRCRQARNADRAASTRDANRIHRQRGLSGVKHGDGSMTITVELPEELGDLVMKTIEVAMTDAERKRAATEEDIEGTLHASRDASESVDEGTFVARQADALVDVVKAYLSGGKTSGKSSAEQYQIMVHVDERALRTSDQESSTTESKSDLPIETVRRLCCDGSIVPVTEDKDGNLLNMGRKHRVVQPALKRALLSRDKQCSYPGCTHDKWLDAHHVKHWADGGETKLDNTLLLCSRHHRLLHEGGYHIKNNYKGERYFETNQGRVVG